MLVWLSEPTRGHIYRDEGEYWYVISYDVLYVYMSFLFCRRSHYGYRIKENYVARVLSIWPIALVKSILAYLDSPHCLSNQSCIKIGFLELYAGRTFSIAMGIKIGFV